MGVRLTMVSHRSNTIIDTSNSFKSRGSHDVPTAVDAWSTAIQFRPVIATVVVAFFVKSSLRTRAS